MNGEEFQRHTLSELKDLRKGQERLRKEGRDRHDKTLIQFGEIAVSIAEIKTARKFNIKTAFFGVLGGFLPALGVLIYFLVNK